MLPYPIICLLVFNIGMGLILSAMYIFFKDVKYLYSILTTLLLYVSAVFYTVDVFTPLQQSLFYINPVYSYISYFRIAVINGAVPPLWLHALCLGYAAAALFGGAAMYHKNNYKFLYYI